MSALEQSLDSIIASTSSSKSKPSRGGKRSTPIGRNSGRPVRVGKSVANDRKYINKNNTTLRKLQKASASQIAKLEKAKQQRSATVVSPSSLNYAQKVVVSGLPKDIKSEAVKEFFESQIGGIQSISLSYNAKGQPTGVATVTFRQSKFAQTAVERFHGSLIDNGKSKLKLELIVDPTLRPLADRITPNPVPSQPKNTGVSLKARLQQKSNDRRNSNGGPRRGSYQQGTSRGVPQQVARRGGAKAVKPKKKTVEQLDQEMADYFTNGDQ